MMIELCVCGCKKELPQSSHGRHRRYFSDACRQRVHRRPVAPVSNRDIAPVTNQNGVIKPILKYTGAKWKLAPWLVSFFPAHRHYLEPYCGSAACFFLKPPAAHEVLNDLNGSIVNLFTVIRTMGEELARVVEMTPWSESEYHAIEKNVVCDDELEHARRFLVRCWQAHGGTLHQTSGWKHNGLNATVYPVKLWRQLPSRLLAVVDRLRDAEIRNKPALEMIDYYNAPDTLIYCLAKGTLIRTVDERFIPIECIREGEMIAPGRTVKRVMHRIHQGQVRSIRIQGMPDTLTVTDEHRIVRIPGRKSKRQDQRTDVGLWKQKETVEASALQVGDYLLVPLGGIESEMQWEWRDRSRKNGARRTDVRFTPGPELFRFLGYYTAEGHLQRQGDHVTEVILSFNTNEISTHIADVIHCCQTVFGITPHIRPGPSAASVTQVCIRSTTIAEFVERYVPGRATTKILMQEIMTAPHTLQRELLIGWLRGDGGMHVQTRNRVKLCGTTSSETLARQMFNIALRCGLRPSFKRRLNHAAFQGRNSKDEVKSSVCDIYFASEDASILGWNVPSNRFCSTRRIIEGHMLVRVKEIDIQEYSGEVYDLDVDGDDTFTAPYALVHNCDPPYMLSTRARKYYGVEMTDDDHVQMLEALDRHKGPVVLSGYAHPLYDERLSHWQRIEMATNGEHGKSQVEVIWLNGKVPTVSQGTLL